MTVPLSHRPPEARLPSPRLATAGLLLGALLLLPGLALAAPVALSGDPGLSVPARSATDLRGQPDRLDEQERKQLNDRYGKVLASELGLLKALDDLDRRVEATEQRLARLGVQRAAATDELRQAETARARAERRLNQMRKAVRARLRALIRLRRAPALRMLLAPKEFRDRVVEDRLLNELVAGARERLVRYRAQLAQVRSRTGTRNTALRQLDDLDRQVHAEKAGLERQRHDKLALITQIEADPLYNERARRDLDAANQLLLDKITTLKQWQERRFTFDRTRGRLLKPVNRSAFEVSFGPRRHPRFGTVTLHRGVDIRPYNPIGAAVRAVFWGRVAFVGWQTGYGRTIILDHGKGWHSVYAHVQRVQVKEGEVVRSRARLAEVGSSGSLKGRYLYFEIRENGQPRDPLQWIR